MSSESGVISPELADIWRVLVKFENYRFYKFRVDILRRIAEYITTSVVFYSPRR